MRWLSLFLRIVAPFLSVYVTYLVIANLALNTGALKATLNHAKPDRVHFEWSSAYTVWFFRVHTRNFALRGQDNALQWYMTFDRATVTFAPTDFAKHRVHMKHGIARGVAIRIRSRLDPAKVDREFTSKLPEIPNYSDPPLRPAVIPPPKPGHEGWSVFLDDVIGDDVHDVWVDDVHFIDATGHVEGGFSLKPNGRLAMPPTRYDAANARILIGEDELASSVHGMFGLEIDEFELKSLHALHKLRPMEARAKVRARVADFKALSYLIRSSHVTLSGGEGVLDFDGGLDHGIIAPHSRGELRSSDWHASAMRDAMAGTSLVFVRAGDDAAFRASVQTFDYTLARDRAVVTNAPAVGLAIVSHDLDVTEAPEHWGGSIDVPASSIPDLRALNGYFGSAFLPVGTGKLSGHADFSPHVARVKFDLTDVNAGKQRGWWASVAMSPMRIDGPVMSCTISGKMRDARVPLEILDAPHIVETLFGHQSFTYGAHLHVAPHAFALEDAHAVGDKLEVLAHYEKHQQKKTGAVLVLSSVMNVGVDIHDDKPAIKPFASQGWYASTRPR